jgi:hypothetical protein
MNRNQDPRSSHRDPNRAAIAAVTVTLLGGIVLFGGKEDGSETDLGQRPQGGETPAGHVGHPGRAQPGGQEHHPLPWFESDTGPDGKIDFHAHKHTEDGVTSYRIDGGTPAPAPEQPEK